MPICTHTALIYQLLSFVIFYLFIFMIVLFICISSGKGNKKHSFPAMMHTGMRCDPMECPRRSAAADQEICEMSVYSITVFPALLLCTSQSSSPSGWQHSKTKCNCWERSTRQKLLQICHTIPLWCSYCSLPQLLLLYQ